MHSRFGMSPVLSVLMYLIRARARCLSQWIAWSAIGIAQVSPFLPLTRVIASPNLASAIGPVPLLITSEDVAASLTRK